MPVANIIARFERSGHTYVVVEFTDDDEWHIYEEGLPWVWKQTHRVVDQAS